MTNTITFKWNTGNIEIAACAVLDMTASQLKNLVKTATANAEEVKNQIAEYIQSEIEKLNPKSEYDKKMIAQYNKLISAAVGERRQTAQEKAIAKIMKNCSSAMSGSYAGVFTDAEKHCVCDGYRLVRYAAPLDNFPSVVGGLNTAKAIGEISAYTVALALPTVKDLKSDMKIAKLSGMDVNRIHIIRKGKHIDFGYDFGYGLPMVNAKYLIDMIEALPDCEAFMMPDRPTAPIYFVSSEDDGILLPIRKMQEYAAAPAVETVEEKPIEKPVEEVKISEEVKEAPEVNHPSSPVQDVPTVKNLSQFKKAISAGYAFKIVKHFVKPELAGQIRQPNKIQTNSFYSVVYGEPNNPVSLANDGKGYYLNYGKAGDWDFTGDTIKMYASGKPVWEITFDLSYEIEEAHTEDTEKEAADMRVSAVAAVVNDDAAHVPEYVGHYIEAYKRGMITEDEAKDALLCYTVPLALPAHVEAAQVDESACAVSSVIVVHPTVLSRSGRHCRHAKHSRPDVITVYHSKADYKPRMGIMNNAFCLNSS